MPEERARALKRIGGILARFPNGLPDRANGYLHGLNLGWVVSHLIGRADADEVEALLPPRPGDVISPVPYGPDGLNHPELETLTEDDIPNDLSFSFWMGLKRHLYFFAQRGTEMPERNALAWLGYLRGVFESNDISQAEYDKLRSMLPPVNDDLTRSSPRLRSVLAQRVLAKRSRGGASGASVRNTTVRCNRCQRERLFDATRPWAKQ